MTLPKIEKYKNRIFEYQSYSSRYMSSKNKLYDSFCVTKEKSPVNGKHNKNCVGNQSGIILASQYNTPRQFEYNPTFPQHLGKYPD